LLEMLAQRGNELSVKDLSVQAELPPSHVCRLLKTLVATGYLEQGPETRKYRVSLKILTLSQARLRHLDLRRAGHPFVAQLGEDLQAPVFLSAPCQGRSIIVDVVWPRGAAGDPVMVVGQVHSVCHSACGKVCAAFATPEELARIGADLASADPPESLDGRQGEFRLIRETRFAVRDEQGILAVAAPLFRAGGLFTGAIGVMLPAGMALASEVEQAVRRTATAISFALGQPFAH
jgi:DNA-binding IclR family transcriptional regulator